jgi:hypothetical protein
MHKWEKEKFCWEMLEEVYGRFPSALAAAIRQIDFEKPNKLTLQGVFVHSFSWPLSFIVYQKLKSISTLS